MTIFELSVPTLAGAFANVQPFVYAIYPGIWATGDYWTTAFGAPAESNSEAMYITSFSRDGINRYSGVLSLADCIAIEMSYFWDHAAQRLYVHFEHDQYPSGPVYQFGKVLGFTKDRAVYIDDIFYSPVLESIPSLAQQQDLENYDALAFLSGSVKLFNHRGELDFAIDTPVIGYDCTIGNLVESAALSDDATAITDGGEAVMMRPLVRGCDSYSRSELQALAVLYVEKQSAKLSSLTLSLQDRRKKQNIKVPTELFTVAGYPNLEDFIVDKPIPLLYGNVRAAPAICVNGKLTTGIVEYRIAQELVSIGTVQIKKNVDGKDVWTTVATASVDLTTGSFTLSSVVGRNSSGNPYDCRMLNPNQTIARIDEATNPVIAGAIETSRIMEGNTCTVFYSSGGGALMYAWANDALCKTMHLVGATDIAACRFPHVFKFDGYYYCISHIVDQGPMYMWRSLTGMAWTILNGGNPVMSRSVDTSSIYRYFWNPAICMDPDGDTMHFVIECGTQGDQSDVGLGYAWHSLSYLLSHVDFTFNPQLSSDQIIPGGGNPEIKYIPDRAALLVLAGSVNTKGRTYWQIMASYAYLGNNLFLPESWTESPFFQVSYPGMHTADPDLIEMPATKTYGILMGYMYNQASSYQCYFDMTLTELFDAIVGVAYKPGAIIKALNLRYLGVQYTDTEYGKTEWEASEAGLSTIGIFLDSQVELYEAIRKIQAGANIGFRYEFNSAGQRTMRLDDWEASPTFRIAVEDIINIDDMEIETDPIILAATIKLNYAKDYTGETKDLSVIDSSQAKAVRLAYAQDPQLEFDSLLQTQVLAAASALAKAEKYGVARKMLTLTVMGHEFLALRIYDIGIVEATPAGYDMDSSEIMGTRKWAGVWKAIVLDINPDPVSEKNTLKLALIEDITP